jgi:hypothetical protein
LDAYANNNSDDVRDNDIPAKVDGVHNTIFRISPGVERYYICDIGNPAASPTAEAHLPIFWEMPEKGQDRILACFLDGHVGYADFPTKITTWMIYEVQTELSAAYMNHLRKAMGLPMDPNDPWASPIAEVTRKLARGTRRSEGLVYVPSVSCDKTPTVHVNGYAGYRVVVDNDIKLILFPAQDNTRPNISAETLPFDDGKNSGNTRLNKPKRVFLGTGMGFHWYGQAYHRLQSRIQKECDLVGGEEIQKEKPVS